MGVWVEDLSEVNLESSLPKNPDALVAAEALAALGPLILPEWLKIDHHPKVLQPIDGDWSPSEWLKIDLSSSSSSSS